MGPIGFPEMVVIMLLALVLFGPRRLPELGRTLGRGMAEFRKASNELKRTLNAEMIQEEIRQGTEVIREHDPRRMLRDALKEAPGQVRDEPKSDEPKSDEPKSDESKSDEPKSDAKTPESDPEGSTEATSDEPSSTDTDPVKPESPEGTVARSRGSSPATQEPPSNTPPHTS